MTETLYAGKMPILALRGLAVFPDQTVHFDVGRAKSIHALDAAMKQVESANKNMVDNMQQVQDIMVAMATGIKESEYTTVTMMNKYEETARNVIKIEQVVGVPVSRPLELTTFDEASVIIDELHAAGMTNK